MERGPSRTCLASGGLGTTLPIEPRQKLGHLAGRSRRKENKLRDECGWTGGGQASCDGHRGMLRGRLRNKKAAIMFDVCLVCPRCGDNHVPCVCLSFACTVLVLSLHKFPPGAFTDIYLILLIMQECLMAFYLYFPHKQAPDRV